MIKTRKMPTSYPIITIEYIIKEAADMIKVNNEPVKKASILP